MLTLLLPLLGLQAHAGPPTAIDSSVLPTFPRDVRGLVDVECFVEMVSDREGRLEVLELDGCAEPFARAVRDRLTWMTWRTPPSVGPGPLQSTYALLTGRAGVPGGLLVRVGIRFSRGLDGEPTVSLVPHEVVRPKKKRAQKLVLPAELESEVGDGCLLLVHVDPAGRPCRVQTETCPEPVLNAFEVPLMLWAWQPLVVDNERKAFTATFRIVP